MPHLLKKLELNGFKSFAERTKFEFPEGIAAIVGSNGSGKTNVIDAIRWLLGERDAKNLRGGKSEDLIFGGTAKRSRLGQAEASLHFENVGNFFPVDFSEIVVSRKVNRDGANQYYINGAEVRLKDLVDFFAQVRLGARGLVVITQGNSDLFVRVSPLERREMVEEMLGLREYQLKKAEAERRLMHTQINLDKVRALTEEILPHLRSLKRQTLRWEKRGQLEEELRGLENVFFGGAYRELSELLRDDEEKTAKKREEFSALDAARANAEADATRVEATRPAEREELAAVKRATRELFDERSRLQKEIGGLEARIEMNAAAGGAEDTALPSQEALYALVKKVKTELGRITYADLAAVEEAIHGLLAEIDAVIAAAKSSDGSDARRAGKDGIEAECKKIHASLADLEIRLKKLGERERGLEKNQEEFYVAFKRAMSARDQARQRVEQWEAANRELQFEKERIELRLEEWRRQVEHAGRKPEEFRNTHVSMAPQGHAAAGDRREVERRMFKLRGDLASIGEIDEALLAEARETESRYEFLNRETADLERARDDLKTLIAELKAKLKSEFGEALVKINKELRTFFELMFGGGYAELMLARPKAKAVAALGEEPTVQDAVDIPEEEEEAEEGVEIGVRIPKKRITSLEMLSGGERSLVGIAALFALISVSPPPFLVLDEVDAPLDEQNARRFADMLKRFSKETQFVLVTHNRATMEAANVLYGVTMNDDGTSKVVALKLDEYGNG